MRADLLDRLLVTLSVRLRAFSICRIQHGWRLNFGAFDAVTIHYVLRGTGSLRVEGGPWLPFAPHSIIVVPVRRSHVMGEAGDAIGEARAEDHCALHGDGLVTFRAGDGTPDTLLVCGQISASYEGALGLFELFQAPMIESFPSRQRAARLLRSHDGRGGDAEPRHAGDDGTADEAVSHRPPASPAAEPR